MLGVHLLQNIVHHLDKCSLSAMESPVRRLKRRKDSILNHVIVNLIKNGM